MHELHLNRTIFIGYWKMRKSLHLNCSIFLSAAGCGLTTESAAITTGHLQTLLKSCSQKWKHVLRATGLPVSVAWGEEDFLSLLIIHFPTKNFPCTIGESSETRGSYNWKLDCSLAPWPYVAPVSVMCPPVGPVLHVTLPGVISDTSIFMEATVICRH